MGPGPRLDPLVAAIALFGPMSVVLASVSPIAVKLAARDIERLGRTAGRLFAISTAGSIAGTFATSFWLVPEYGTDQVLALGALVLLVAAAAVALLERLWLPGAGLVAAAGAALLAVGALAPDTTGKVLAGSAARNWSPLYREREVRTPRKLDPAEVGLGGEGFTVREARDTRYHRLLVVEDGTSRYLRFDSSFQSGMYLKRPFATRFSYSDYLQLGLAYNPSARKILVIGLGGAAVQKRLWRDFRDVEVTTVELDPAVVDVAYRWFHLPRDPRLPVEVDDGRRFLQRTDERFDVIMVDAFYSDGVPFHMTTLEFAQLMRDRLTPGRRGRDERDRRAHGRQFRDHARAVEDLRGSVPDRRAASGLRGPRRPLPGRHPEHHPRRHRASRPVARAPCRVLGGDTRRTRADGARPAGGRARPLGAGRRDG